MSVLAAVGERKPRRVAEPIGRAVHHLGHHGKRLYRPRADARRQQQLGKILRPELGCRGKRAVQAGALKTSLDRTS